MLRFASWASSLILSLCCLAQNEFNRRYDSFDQLQVQEGWAVEMRPDSGILVVHMSQLTEAGHGYLLNSVLVLDDMGNLDTVTRVPLDTLNPSVFCGWANASDKRSDQGIVIGGALGPQGGPFEGLLMLFDSTGSFDTMYTYLPEAASFIGRQAKQTPDGGFVLVGSRSLSGDTRGFLLKTDASGVQEWVQTYGGASYDEFLAVHMIADGGYYLGGSRFVPGSSYQHWVLRVDNLGATAWSRIWGGPSADPAAHLMASADGHAVVASASASSNVIGKLYLAKLDSTDGSTIWERTYGGATGNTTLFAVKEVQPFGDLIATGQAYQNNGEIGVLLRTTSTGDSLWMRTYKYHDAVIDSGDGQLRDVLPTPDGGFIAVGVAFGTGPYSQDVWVIKTDSMGCIEPGCNLIQGMATQITNLRDALSVAPNPVASGGTAQVSIALPKNFTPQGALRITVVGSDGRLVHEQIMQCPAGQLTTDNLRPGLYHIHLSDATRWISGAKLVIE